jgi:hypothetical protein
MIITTKHYEMKWGIERLLVGISFIVLAQGAFAEKLVEKIGDFVANSALVEWVDTVNQKIPAVGDKTEHGLVQKRLSLINSSIENIGNYESEVLYMEATPALGLEKTEMKIQGRLILHLPEKRYIQFQGLAEGLEGKDDGLELNLNVETNTGKEWQLSHSFVGKSNTAVRQLEHDFRSFIIDLSEWSGQDVRLSLSMNANPAYQKIGEQEQWFPAKISAQWITAEIISSKFKVILGAEEWLSAEATPKAIASQTSIVPTTYAEELVLEGYDNSLGMLKTGTDSCINSVLLPAAGEYSSRFVCYLGSSLASGADPHGSNHTWNSPESVYAAGTRMIDFTSNPTKNMYNANTSEIQNALYQSNGKAVSVLSPSGDACRDFDDHYTAITSVHPGTLDLFGYPSVVHGFFHAEDHFQFENNDGDCHGQSEEHNTNPTTTQYYARIGYARSVAGSNDFGRSFNKLYSADGNPIITYKTPEENINMSFQNAWGCGSPTVMEIGDYYYMIYTTWSMYPGNTFPDIDPVTGGNKNCAVISLARALKSDVNSYLHVIRPNPWYKYKEVNTASPYAAENFTEPGIGGNFSAVWNAEVVNGLRTDQANRSTRSQWRAFSKLSYNDYLDQNYPGHQGLLVIQGPAGIYIHTCSELTHWDDGLCILPVNHTVPTIIGSYGYDVVTSEYNKIYYRRNDETYNPVHRNLYRRSLRIQVVP